MGTYNLCFPVLYYGDCPAPGQGGVTLSAGMNVQSAYSGYNGNQDDWCQVGTDKAFDEKTRPSCARCFDSEACVDFRSILAYMLLRLCGTKATKASHHLAGTRHMLLSSLPHCMFLFLFRWLCDAGSAPAKR